LIDLWNRKVAFLPYRGNAGSFAMALSRQGKQQKLLSFRNRCWKRKRKHVRSRPRSFLTWAPPPYTVLLYRCSCVSSLRHCESHVIYRHPCARRGAVKCYYACVRSSCLCAWHCFFFLLAIAVKLIIKDYTCRSLLSSLVQPPVWRGFLAGLYESFREIANTCDWPWGRQQISWLRLQCCFYLCCSMRLFQPGADPAGKVRGGAISVIIGSQVSLTASLLQARRSMLHNTAVTKQWTTKWPYIANVVFSELVQIYGE